MGRIKDIVGLDIGSSSVKIVSSKIENKQPIVNKFSIFDIPFGKQLNSALLRDFYDKSGIDSKKVNTSIAGPCVVLRYVTLPKIKPNEVRSALKFELEKNIPFSIEEVITDGQIIREVNRDKVLVLAAAAKKDFIQSRIKLLQDAGLVVNAIDIDALAVINAFLFQIREDLTKKNIALLNLGANFSNLSILKKGIPSFNRDISIGGVNLTKKIANVMGLSFSDAENAKLNPADKYEQVNQICESITEDLISEVKFSFDYFESKESEPVNQIFLSGGSCKLDIVGKLLDETLAISHEIWDPTAGFKFDEGIDENNVKSVRSRLAVAIGLLVRQL